METIFNRKNSTQLIIHILFWLLFIFISLFVFTRYYWTENPFLHYFFLLLAIVYCNYFLLLPYFMSKKWYALYSIIFLSISFFATQLYCNVFARCGCSIMKCLSDYLWQTLVPLLFFSFLWMLFKYLDEQEKFEKATQERTEIELKFLKSQINPHVLLNNLNTIYAYSIEKPNHTPDLILKLSDNLKHVLYETNSETVLLEKEINFLQNYIDFQRIRTEGVKEIEFTTKLDNNLYKIAPLLLITIIENAFKHSAVHSKIRIEISAVDSVLTLSCLNSFDPKNVKNKNTIGLQNLEKRLSLLYPEKHLLNISREDNLFSVSLTLYL